MTFLLNASMEDLIANTQCSSPFSDSHHSQYDSRSCVLRTKLFKIEYLFIYLETGSHSPPKSLGLWVHTTIPGQFFICGRDGWSPYGVQAGLELLASSGPLVLASQSVGIIGLLPSRLTPTSCVTSGYSFNLLELSIILAKLVVWKFKDIRRKAFKVEDVKRTLSITGRLSEAVSKSSLTYRRGLGKMIMTETCVEEHFFHGQSKMYSSNPSEVHAAIFNRLHCRIIIKAVAKDLENGQGNLPLSWELHRHRLPLSPTASNFNCFSLAQALGAPRPTGGRPCVFFRPLLCHPTLFLCLLSSSGLL
ncbi:hypothetical protein AAY473_018145 [Plecturocebus cupreus]